MKYSDLEIALDICYDANITLFLWGHTGVGKSSKIRQHTGNHKMGFIDMRLAQMEAADLRGLPHRHEGRTIFLPPNEMPIADLTWDEIQERVKAAPENKRVEVAKNLQKRAKTGILFLDEMPRAAEDVQQAAFELVLDRSVGEYVLPPGWGVVCAGNFLEGYQQTGFSDPAFIARFCHLTLSTGSTTLEEWVDYMAGKFGAHASKVIEFASSNLDHLDGKRTGELGFNIEPCRRSWEMVARIYRVSEGKNYPESIITEVVGGLIGVNLAQSFASHDLPVKPMQIVQEGVRHHSAQLKVIAKNRVQLTGLMWGLLSVLRPRVEEEKFANIALDFAQWMCDEVNDHDLIVAFCRCMAGTGGGSDGDHIRAAAISNPRVADLLTRVRKNAPNTVKRFVERLNERPKLQKILSKVSWGRDIDESVPLVDAVNE